MLVKQADAVAICQDYGFATADGWTVARLSKKLSELVQLYRNGEFEPSGDLSLLLKRIAELESGGESIEIGDDSAGDETISDVGSDDSETEACLLSVGDRVIVHDSEEDWKGIVGEIIRSDRVMVRDRRGETWEVAVEKCEIVKHAADIDREKKGMKKPSFARQKQQPKARTPEDEEIRELEERLRVLRFKRAGYKKTGRSKLKRDELAVKVLQAHPEGDTLEQLAEELDLRWQRQGRQSNPRMSVSCLKRIVKAGILFGLLRMEGGKVLWLSSE